MITDIFACDLALLERGRRWRPDRLSWLRATSPIGRGAAGLACVRLGALLGIAATMINWTALWRAFMIGCPTAMLWGNGGEAGSQPVFFVVGP